MDSAKSTVAPKPLLSVADGVFLMAGMVIGAGIFKAPSIVAGNTASNAEFLLVWLFGGLISLCGALVYAELASRHPGAGGEYTFLSAGLGRGAGFLFAWSRMTVIQTGAIAAVAFVFGEYASQVAPLGKNSTAVWAAISVTALTLLNLIGTLQSKTLQKVMETILILSLLGLAVLGMAAGGPRPEAKPPSGDALDFALLFVLFTYGGWNEAAYLAGEVKDPKRNMLKVLVLGIVVVTALYLLVNIGYLAALGLGGLAGSKAVGADVMRLALGEKGATVFALVVCVSVLTTINAAIFTGARTTWAMGQDFNAFRRLGTWRDSGSTPADALILQGVMTMILLGLSAATPDGFSAMVAYTAPVFWTFFLLTAITIFVLRRTDREAPVFRLPFAPIIGGAFCLMCAFMLWKSIAYIFNPQFGPKFGNAVLGGLVVMAIGIPVYFLQKKKKGP